MRQMLSPGTSPIKQRHCPNALLQLGHRTIPKLLPVQVYMFAVLIPAPTIPAGPGRRRRFDPGFCEGPSDRA